ncbi:hypothetical protein DPQ33_07630 [Oceanidesulfovibrio indonesiensis]|uniref:Uncharacterized protein n=1 Tax=Oceanidesulfovibrio indonesiensis TaxID=54767 RepID=A0A7M3MGF0_9BACT|nr:hypothetical protein [Oceanidesulfovibrio indonesiensis]TVM17969.1 hypothetical protein DPQ33_07630 [Oceanidesulfovibrio indonesiensis]
MFFKSIIACLAVLLGLAAPSANAAPAGVWEPTGKPGIWFVWYAPSFYTGYAPRSQEADKVHIHMGRGNQVRITVVMTEELIDNYPQDLMLREDTITELVEKDVIDLYMNMSWERFQETLADHGVRELAESKASMDPAEYRRKSLELMRALNPDQVWHIQMNAGGLCSGWLERHQGAQPANASDKLALVNDILPTRLWHMEMTQELEQTLSQALAAQDAEGVMPLLKAAAGDLYPVEDGRIDVWEYTTIYPAGTHDSFTTVDGERIPNFPVTGVWDLTSRDYGKGQLGMVDYLSTNPGYGFITMLPYQHAGSYYYNAFHNDGIRIPVSKSFMPQEWKNVQTEREGEHAGQFWACSRGPVSHGCTRVPSDLMGEFRHILPSDAEKARGLPTFRNDSACFDVYDIDGDGTPEVMGIKYYLAYRAVKPRDPVEIRVKNTRDAYYPWLYGKSAFVWNEDGSVTFPKARTCQFVGRKAVAGKVYENVRLFEPDYHGGDKLQFYTLNPVNFETDPGFTFNRELRNVGWGYKADRKKLFLE